jgi:hypothetical protein
MLIKRHDKSYIVEMEDGSRWRIWPGDLATTLKWTPSTQLSVLEIDDQFCTHALVDQADGTRVRVIAAKRTGLRKMSKHHCKPTNRPDDLRVGVKWRGSLSANGW